MTEPATNLSVDLRLRADGLVPVVNSRDVAEVFKKQHGHVIRDINGLEISPDLERSWFRPAPYVDGYGREQPSYDMTRDGFTILAFGWNGPRAMDFKVRYIQAFNAMEAELRNPTGLEPSHELFLSAVRVIVAPLAVRFDGQDRALERVEDKVQHVSGRVDGIAEDVAFLKSAVRHARRNLTQATKRSHVADVHELGGRCPCCGISQVVDENGNRLQFTEYDHFYASSHPNVDHTWLICKPCHHKLTYGSWARDQKESQFKSYQLNRRALPGRQPSLF